MAAARAASPASPWSNDIPACVMTWITFVTLEQSTKAFPRSGKVKMRNLAFWAGSDDLRSVRAKALAIQVDVYCASSGYGYNECELEGKILKWEFTNQVSNTTCVKKQNYGKRGRKIWVDDGCRADFTVWTY